MSPRRRTATRLASLAAGRCFLEVLEHRWLLSTRYVDMNAPGPAHDGTTWETAYTDLQAALVAAAAGDQIRVADGTYKPTSGTDRTISFRVPSAISVLGGYAGSGAVDPDARDPSAYVTVLSGDIGLAADPSDNSYHVITTVDAGSETLLEGFTVLAGNANGPGWHSYGGGMHNTGGAPRIADCIFTGNYGAGAGMHADSSSPTLTGCTFIANTGGGISSTDGSSVMVTSSLFTGNSGSAITSGFQCDLVLTDCQFLENSTTGGGGAVMASSGTVTATRCTFTRNTGGQGGAMSLMYATATVTDCGFFGNVATFQGGGIYNYGGMTLTNGLFVGNRAQSGGGVYNYASASLGAAVKILNCTFYGNAATSSGGGVYLYDQGAVLVNCIAWANTAPTHAQLTAARP